MNQSFREFSSFSWEKYGQFGDSFGYLTAAFTAGAFYLLWKTYNAQKKELRETRESIERQRLQNTFISVLKMCESAYANARYDYCSEKEGKITYKGTSAIYYVIANYLGGTREQSEGAFAVHLMDDFGDLFRSTIVLLSVVSSMPSEMRPDYIKIIDVWLPPAERIMMALISNQFYQQHEDLEVGEVMRPLVGKYLFLAGTQKDRKDQFQAVRDVIDVAKEYGDKI